MRHLKANTVHVAGNVASVDIKTGNNRESFGTVTVAVDDGYFKKDQTGQGGQWVDRTYFVDVKVDNRVITGGFKQGVDKGDQVSIEGKLIQERWDDGQGNSRSAIRVRALSVSGHVRKIEIDALKQAGLIGGNRQQAQGHVQGGYQQQQPQQQQPGYNQAPAPQQSYQQPQQSYNQAPRQHNTPEAQGQPQGSFQNNRQMY